LYLACVSVKTTSPSTATSATRFSVFVEYLNQAFAGRRYIDPISLALFTLMRLRLGELFPESGMASGFLLQLLSDHGMIALLETALWRWSDPSDRSAG
jgi:hypothetical protein